MLLLLSSISSLVFLVSVLQFQPQVGTPVESSSKFVLVLIYAALFCCYVDRLVVH